MLSTVATNGLEEVHGLVAAGIPEPESCLPLPAQETSVPVIVGNGFTVTTVAAEVAEQPDAFVTVTVYEPATEVVIAWVVAPLLHK